MCVCQLFYSAETLSQMLQQTQSVSTDLLQLTNLIVEVVDTPLIFQAELRQQICTELRFQRLSGGLHGMEAGLQTLKAALLDREREEERRNVKQQWATLRHNNGDRLNLRHRPSQTSITKSGHSDLEHRVFIQVTIHCNNEVILPWA